MYFFCKIFQIWYWSRKQFNKNFYLSRAWCYGRTSDSSSAMKCFSWKKFQMSYWSRNNFTKHFYLSWAWWRNGSASDSSSEGCVFKSRPGQWHVFLGKCSKCDIEVGNNFTKNSYLVWAWWRNGSASDSSSEGCVFKSRPGHLFYINVHFEILILRSHIVTKSIFWCSCRLEMSKWLIKSGVKK